MNKVLEIALGELGQCEIAGGEDNPRIVEYNQSTSLRATDDETPWCASFVNWVLKQSGITGTDSAAARSFLKWGEESKPLPGAIVVFKRGSQPWMGHVGFVVSISDSRVSTLGGNQGNSVSVVEYKREDVLGFRKPKSAKSSKTVLAAGVTGGASLIPLFAGIDPQEIIAAASILIAAAGVIWERLKKIKLQGI